MSDAFGNGHLELYEAHQSAFGLRMHLWDTQRIDPSATLCRPVIKPDREIVLQVSVSPACEKQAELPHEFNGFRTELTDFDGVGSVQAGGVVPR